MISTRRRLTVLLMSLLCLIFAVTLGLGIGAVHIPAAEALTGLLHGDPLIHRYRLPRVAVGALAGSAMAVAGAILQTALRNPLAAPDLVGVTAGGGLAAVLTLLAAGPLPAGSLTPAALVGALGGGLLTLLAAGRRRSDPVALALCGLAVGVALSALTTLVLVRSAPEAGAAMTWLKGSLYARTLGDLVTVLPWALVGFTAAALLLPAVDRLRLDDATLASVGFPVTRSRILLVLAGCLLTAAAVAAAGVLAFVGLVVPHLARLLVGAAGWARLCTAALLGGALVVFADALGRTLAAPTEIPVGAVVATLGAPYFIWLLARSHQHGKDVR